LIILFPEKKIISPEGGGIVFVGGGVDVGSEVGVAVEGMISVGGKVFGTG
jgi:hypothetical protein